MQTSLLIVDSIATNRVALKVKLAAAWYDVTTAATGEEALERIGDLMPNLVLLNNALPDMNVAEFSARLKASMGKAMPPLLALSDAPQQRETLLRSGVEDVLPIPVDDQMLLARIRSVLRATAAEAEWRLRDSTSRALGFAEPRQLFDRPVPVCHVHSAADDNGPADRALTQHAGIDVQSLTIGEAMCQPDATAGASVIVIELPRKEPASVLPVVSDLRSHLRTRHKALLVVAPDGRTDLAAQALDLGADDAVAGHLPGSELVLRAQRLHARREINDSLRMMLKNGAEAALRDPLTGLFNRRYALPHLERISEQARISGRPYAVMVADLDHFKRINDWYGHDAGDAVLVECAKRLQQNMRAVDLVARIGGEEFLIVLPGTGRAAARQAALRLCRVIGETPISLPGRAETIDVTVSIGLALSNGISADAAAGLLPPEAPDDLISRADRALYRAKEMGRNRFIVERAA